jgi:uncharacterized membrane protein
MACNPVVQYNDFIGDGVTVDFTFTFPYILKTEVMVRVGEYNTYTYPVYQTEYTVSDANPTVVTFVTAPTGPFRIFRCTDASVLPATFQAGSAIRASDLNDNFEQTLFIVQDANIRSKTAQETADEAYSIAQEAIAIANEALAKAEEALEKANAALELVQEQVIGEIVPNIPSLPASPEEGTVYTVVDSTGVESMSPPPNSLPDSFIGNPDVSVKLYWNGSSYDFLEAFARDPDNRYYTQQAADDKFLTKVDAAATYLCLDFSKYPLLP